MSELADKERRAIKILRMYKGDDPISDNGLSNFKAYPKIAKQWIKAGQRFLDTHPDTITARRFEDGYQYFAAHLFDSLDVFEAVTHASLFSQKEDWKQRLEDFFKIEV